LELVDGYLQQLLPALASAGTDTDTGKPFNIAALSYH
jgi:hypothetical protein